MAMLEGKTITDHGVEYPLRTFIDIHGFKELSGHVTEDRERFADCEEVDVIVGEPACYVTGEGETLVIETMSPRHVDWCAAYAVRRDNQRYGDHSPYWDWYDWDEDEDYY